MFGSYLLYKRPLDWTNEEMDWIEHNADVNCAGLVVVALERKGIPCSVNVGFYKRQGILKWLYDGHCELCGHVPE